MLAFFISLGVVEGKGTVSAEWLGDGFCTLDPELELERGRARDPRRDPPLLTKLDREP